MAFGIVEGNKLINYTLGETRVTIIGRNMGEDGKSPGDFGIYSALIGKPDEGFNPPIGTILARNGDLQDLYGHNGEFLGTTIGNYTLQERNASLSFVNDFLYLANGAIAKEVTKNVLVNMLTAEIFKAKVYGGTEVYIKPYGTNGNYKTQVRASMEPDLSNIFYKEGRMVVPQSWNPVTGEVYQKDNSRVTAYNTGSLCVMIETLTTFDSQTKEGFRWVYTLPGNVTMSENMDFNKISMDCAFLSDARFIEDFWILEQNSPNEILGTELSITAVTGTGSSLSIADSSSLVAGNKIKITTAGTGVLAEEMKEGIYFYIKTVGPGTFTVSLTLDGDAVDFGEAGVGTAKFKECTTLNGIETIADLTKSTIDAITAGDERGDVTFVTTDADQYKYAIVAKSSGVATLFGTKYYLPIYDFDYDATSSTSPSIPTFKKINIANTTVD